MLSCKELFFDNDFKPDGVCPLGITSQVPGAGPYKGVPTMLERAVLETEADPVALCFYEWEQPKTGKKEIQAKRMDWETGVSTIYKPFSGETVRDGEMWLCRPGEVVYQKKVDGRVVMEIVRVIPTRNLGHVRGQIVRVEFDCVSGSRQTGSTIKKWQASRRVYFSCGCSISVLYVLDKESTKTPAANLYNCRVTKLVHCQSPGRLAVIDLVIAVDIVAPVMANGTKQNSRFADSVT